jgi:AraC-like DNA-binding protein
VTSEIWSGTLHLARDFALLHGSAGPTTTHAHYAHQLLLAEQAPVTVTVDGETQCGTRVLIESQRRHAIVEAPPALYIVYAEPLLFDAALLAGLGTQWRSAAALADAIGQLPRRTLRDTRLVDALADIDAMLYDRISAAALAQRVQLSLSQLERMFSAHIGLSVRRLVRWRRLRLALQLALAGQTLTHAAHDAGFADSAHFSRVMREMFGVRADRTLGGLQAQLLD